MYYREFREELLQMMREQAAERMQIDLIERQKLNGQVRYALMMQREGSAVSPVIYLEEAYEEYGRGNTMEKIADKLWLIYREEMKDNFQNLCGSVSCMKTFDAAAKGLYLRIMNEEKNRGLLQDVPCWRCLDLAMTAYYLVEAAKGQVRGTVMIREEHLQDWDVSLERVFETAAGNTLASEGMYWNTLEAVLKREKLRMFPEQLSCGPTGLYVLSGRTGVWGAVVAFLPGAAGRICQALGEPFYLLPSSIHEVIIVPFSTAVSASMLAGTVREVNRLELPREEILSDHVYFYDAQMDALRIAECKEE